MIDDVCAHLRGGPPGRSANLDLAKAFSLARYFGVETSPRASNFELSDALESRREYRPADACRAPAEEAVLRDAEVTLENGIAIVRPGHGEIAIPDAARAVAVDVRELPESDEARDAVERLLPRLLHGDAMLPALEHRTCNGHPDEATGFLTRAPSERFACRVTTSQRVIHGRGRALPLAVIVAPRLTPAAAEAAALLRGAADAFVVGADVPVALAESRWVGLGESGLAIRVSRFPALPDVLASDAPDVRSVAWTARRERPWERHERGAIRPLEPLVSRWSGAVDPASRAALIAAHAAVRTFHPYRDELDEDLDARIAEAFTLLRGDRTSTRQALRRYTQALHDAQAKVLDPGHAAERGSRVRLVPVAGNELAVRDSPWPDLAPGDVVLAIEHEPTTTWLDEALRFESGSRQHVVDLVSTSLIHPDTVLRIRKADGREQTLVLDARQRPLTTPPAHARPRPPDGVAYVDLTRLRDSEVSALRESLRRAQGLVLDMRGVPTKAAWRILRDVCSPDARGPRVAELEVTPFSRRRLPAPVAPTLGEWSEWPSGSRPREPYDGRAVILVNAHTQAAGEDLLSFFRNDRRGKVIGRPTSGASGTMTGIQLPGGYAITFTGVNVSHADGSRFHGIGHIPDIEVEPTADEVAAGRDPLVERAVAELKP